MAPLKLCLLAALTVLYLTAFAAPSAYALESEWMVETQTFSQLGLKEEGIKVSGGSVTLSVPSKSTTIKCTTVAGSGTLTSAGGDSLSASLSGCEVVKPTTCKISTPVKVSGKAESILTGGNYYEKVVASKAEEPLATLTFSGETCPLPETVKMTGSIAAKPSGEELAKQPLIFSEGVTSEVNKELGAEKLSTLKLLFGTSEALLSGEPSVEFSGAHAAQQGQRSNFTRICDTAQGNNNNCTGTVYATDTDVKTEQLASQKLKFNKVVTCTTSKWEGKTKSAGAAPLPGKFTVLSYTGCTDANGAGCSVDSGASATAPNDFFFETVGDGVGRIVIKKPKFKITCGALVCEFEFNAGAPFLISPGMPAQFSSIIPFQLARTGGVLNDCGATMTWEKSGGGALGYKFTAPGKLWVTG